MLLFFIHFFTLVHAVQIDLLLTYNSIIKNQAQKILLFQCNQNVDLAGMLRVRKANDSCQHSLVHILDIVTWHCVTQVCYTVCQCVWLQTIDLFWLQRHGKEASAAKTPLQSEHFQVLSVNFCQPKIHQQPFYHHKRKSSKVRFGHTYIQQ